jgi:hypothetical protein
MPIAIRNRTGIHSAVLCAATLVLSACATAGASTRHAFQDREEAKLATMLQDRVAGEPRSCITAYDLSRIQILDHAAIVYETGDTIWVSRPGDPHSLDTRDIVVIKRTGGQLCKQDIIKTVDRTSGFTTGLVFMGDFVPYRRR